MSIIDTERTVSALLCEFGIFLQSKHTLFVEQKNCRRKIIISSLPVFANCLIVEWSLQSQISLFSAEFLFDRCILFILCLLFVAAIYLPIYGVWTLNVLVCTVAVKEPTNQCWHFFFFLLLNTKLKTKLSDTFCVGVPMSKMFFFAVLM